MTCWHCGAALPPDPPQAEVAGILHPVCCHGCRSVAEWIAQLGLADYYRLRSGPAERAPEASETFLRPELERHFVRTLGDGTSEAMVLIDGMRCTACTWLIEHTLTVLPGVIEVAVNASASRGRIVFDAKAVGLGRIVDSLARVGYRALPLDGAALDDSRLRETRDAQKRLAVAAFGSMQAMMYASALWFGAFDGADTTVRDIFRWLTLLAATPVVFYSAAPFFSGAARLVRARRLGMDVAVALAIGLICTGSAIEIFTGGRDIWFESVSMFIFFLCVGRYLEMRARHRAGELSDALARLTPPFADRLQPDGSLARVGAFELAPGDRVVVADGGAVPADGTLESGECRVDESLLSGESKPRLKRRGDAMCAGSIVAGTPAVLRVTRVGADTVVAGIVALTTRAASLRPRLARDGERAAAAFVARVLLLATCTALVWTIVDPAQAFAATVAVLVVACPCAFALAAPAAVTRALAVLTSRGVLVVRPDALEDLAGVTHVLFDKTGTLTEPAVVSGPSDALVIAAALSQGGRHPLSRAFCAAAPGPLPAVELRESIAGYGVAGVIAGRRYRLGRGLQENVMLADDDGVIAAFDIDERLRPGARDTVDALARAGITVMITSGDAETRVAAVAGRLGVAQWKARQSPADKLALLASLRAQDARVAVVGDGVNDAPMLAGADVGIAVGTAADVAQAASDIVISGRLEALGEARAIARQTLAILRQNRRWALCYNLATVPLAALGFVPPWLAAIGMSASSVGVVLNALRIGSAPRPEAEPVPEKVALA